MREGGRADLALCNRSHDLRHVPSRVLFDTTRYVANADFRDWSRKEGELILRLNQELQLALRAQRGPIPFQQV